MVILITGASHTGKTLLAQRLLRERGCMCLSIDHLKIGLIRSGEHFTLIEDDFEKTMQAIQHEIDHCNGVLI